MSAIFIDQDGTVRLQGTISDAAGVQTVTRTLTPTEILALNTTPIELVPAPGAGRIIIPGTVVFLLTFATTPYATTTRLYLYMGNPPSSDPLMHSSVNFLAAMADDVNFDDYGNTGPVGNDPIDPALYFDQPLVVTALVADPTAGDSPVTVSVGYYVAAL